ncbi:MAG TPA: hypothetical protein VHZ55_18510 [Bryobacteraceae bacterium]|jgi:hypothetical protein|nr:hypothetical protein [Bryobacteraceae bacterium]
MTGKQSRRGFLQQNLLLPCLSSAHLFEPEILNDSWCLSQESATGYRSLEAAFGGRNIIVAAGLRTVSMARLHELHKRVNAGAWLIWERAATFAEQTVSEFDARFAQIFGIRAIEGTGTQTLYVRYLWPAPTLVRRMGNLPRFEPATAQVIATHAGEPCAFKRNFGKGSVIYLSSMLGPQLAAADESSKLLLETLLRN